jgi:nitrous oxidase accessory protein
MAPWLAVLAGALVVGGRTLVVAPDGPYPDLGAALAAAGDGDTIEVHGGVHAGPFVVAHAVALRGLDRPVLDGRGQGTVVTFEVPGGALTGFTVRNSGRRNDREDAGVLARGTATVEDNHFEDVLFGVDIEAGPHSVIRGNVITGRDLPLARKGDGIRLWESEGSRVEENLVHDTRDILIWYSDNTTVRGNRVSGGRYGLHFMYASGSRVQDNRFEDNAVGAYGMYSADLAYERNLFLANHGPSGYGIALKDSDDITVRDNVIAANRTGMYFDNSPGKPGARNVIAGNTFAYNDIGLAFMPSVKGNIFATNNFVENSQQVAVLAGGRFNGNDWTPGGQGNFWSNYAGYDADRDGVGDLPYQEVSLFYNLLTRRPELRLFVLSPVQLALDLTARAFPVFQPPPTLTDTAPRMAPVVPAVVPSRGRAVGLLALAVAMVSGSLAIAFWGAAVEPRRVRLERPGAVVARSEGSR